jgi:hypothetical protein
MAKTLHARPVCGECGSPVEEFTEEDGTGSLSGRVIFVARWHGAVERMSIYRWQTKGLNFGVAFAPLVPRLPAQTGCWCNRLNCEHAKALPPVVGAKKP